MKNLLLLSLLLAAGSTTHAIPAPSSPVRQKIGQYIKSTSGFLPDRESINKLRQDTLSSSFGFSKVNDVNGAPITFKFGKTSRHKKLRKLPTSKNSDDDADDLQKRQDTNDDNESELLNFDDTRYIACKCLLFSLLLLACFLEDWPQRHACERDLGSNSPQLVGRL